MEKYVIAPETRVMVPLPSPLEVADPANVEVLRPAGEKAMELWEVSRKIQPDSWALKRRGEPHEFESNFAPGARFGL